EIGVGSGGHQVEVALVDLDEHHLHLAVAVREFLGDGPGEALYAGTGGGDPVGGVRLAAVAGDAQTVGGEHHDHLDAGYAVGELLEHPVEVGSLLDHLRSPSSSASVRAGSLMRCR